MRKINKAGIELIQSFESCSLTAYIDPASPLAAEMRKPKTKRVKDWEKLSGEPITIGWGSTGLDYFNLDSNGQPTRIGLKTTWTQAQCDLRHHQDLEKFSAQVDALVKGTITDNQFSALVSFAYNLGAGALKSSSLLKHLNDGKTLEAAQEFLRWNKAKGVVMPGLTRRREAEKALFLKKD